MPAAAAVAREQLSSTQTRHGQNVLEIWSGSGDCAHSGRVEEAAPKGEQKDGRNAAADLEAPGLDVVVRNAVSEEVQDRAEQDCARGRAGKGAPDRPRRDVERDDHVPGRYRARIRAGAMARRHLIGLLLATEEDWPSAFEALLRRLGPVEYGGERHDFTTERITNEPFDLRYSPRFALVIDRLAWWYDLPREWLKKVALMDEVYLLNNPFTFQAMEKHAAYCAMMRLDLRVPDTWLIPHKLPPDNPRYVPMAERYNPPFDLDQVAERIGYPLFMKPFDGGQWIGVTRITDSNELHASYDESGERLMHLQASVEDFDVFTRSLSIGPQTKVMKFDPTAHGHYRYAVDDDFLPPELMREAAAISRLVNAFFRWEFNSCETIVKDGVAFPIDYANASPDIALVSLHYYFPWAIESLVAWCVFCTATDRPMRINQNTRDYFEVAVRDDLIYEQKLERYGELADAYFQADQFAEFRTSALARLDDVTLEYFESSEFDDLLVHAIRLEVEPERHEEMIERCRSLVGQWASDRRLQQLDALPS
jgi:hypothetical protein